MVTRRRGVKHTRRRHRHHAKTKKKLSKRYRGRKGYSKRITRRQMRRSHDTDIINTQSGGNLTIWSAAKTAAGKALELKLISRYLLKNANKTINDYVVSQGITLAEFYRLIAQLPYYNALPLNVQNAVEIYVNVIKLSPTAEHDLPHEIVEEYKKTFTTPEDSSNADISFTDTDRSVGNIEHYDETEFKDEKLKIFKRVDGHVSIKAKKIEYSQDPTSASIDSGDAYRFLTNIFHPSDVPFIMIVVFYTQIDYLLPPLQPDDIQMLSASGVTTTGESRPGNIIFVRKIVKINMTNAIDQICGTLIPEQKEAILTRLAEASLKVKSDIQSERAQGKSICEEVDTILTRAGALLRVSVKDNSDYTKNRIQARLLVNLRQLAEYYEVDDNPAVSPIFGASSSPLVSTSLNMSFSKALDATRQFSERTGPTSFSKKFKPENFAGKSPEQIGIIVVEAMRKDPNFANFFKRIYNTSSGSKKSRPKASRSTTPASAGRKPPASAPRSMTPASAPHSTTPASASKTPSASASRKGAISRAPKSLNRIPENSSIYDRIFPPSRSSTRGPIFSTPNLGVTESTDMEEVD
jgi:hypothetical protein